MKLPTLTLAVFMAATAAAAEVRTISPVEAAKRVDEGRAVLVDVREPAEWAQTGVAARAVLLPKSDFDRDQKQWKEFLAGIGDKEVIVYCRTGRRSGAVAEALAKEGVNVANAGGFSEWAAAKLPTRKVVPAKARK
jgi:rhodanese-related sulfurtransferase